MNAEVRANTASCAVLNRRHIASPCVRGARATVFQRPCSSRIFRAAISRFASAASASICLASSSCTWRLAQRCHSSASRSSCTRGASSARAAVETRPGLPGGRPWSAAARARVERVADVGQRAVPGLQRQLLVAGERLHLPAQLLQALRLSCSCLALTCWCSCSLSSSIATARSTRSAAAGLASAISRSTSVSRRSMRQRVSTSGSGCSAAPDAPARRPASRAERPRRRPAPPPLALLEPPAGVLEPPGQRRRVVGGIGGRLSHLTFSSANRSRAPAPSSASMASQTATRSACSRSRSPPPFFFGRAFGRPHGRGLAHGLDRGVELLLQARHPRRCRPAARPTRRASGRCADRPRPGSGTATSASASATSEAPRWRSSALMRAGRAPGAGAAPHPREDAGGRAPCASPPCSGRAARRRPRRPDRAGVQRRHRRVGVFGLERHGAQLVRNRRGARAPTGAWGRRWRAG